MRISVSVGEVVDKYSILEINYLPSELRKFKKNHCKGIVKVMYDKKFTYSIYKKYFSVGKLT